MVKEAAILCEGKLYVGKRHHQIIKEIASLTNKTPVTGKQGFVDENGKFLDREEALKIAIKCNQVKKIDVRRSYLISEDLY